MVSLTPRNREGKIDLKLFKESNEKGVLSFQKNGVEESNILQQMLWKSWKLFCRYDLLYISLWV